MVNKFFAEENEMCEYDFSIPVVFIKRDVNKDGKNMG